MGSASGCARQAPPAVLLGLELKQVLGWQGIYGWNYCQVKCLQGNSAETC